MLRERIIDAAAVLKPARYWFEGVTYGRGARSRWLDEWKDRFKGQPMLVVGNGPSINETPLEDFKSVPAVGMNKIDLLFPRTSWRPSCILSVSDMVVVQHWKPWVEQDIPVYLSWKTRWYIPRRARGKFNYFLNHLDRAFRPDMRDGVGACWTVTYAALHFAYHCGADPVILFGVDHSFVTPKTGRDGYIILQGEDKNHFDPNYFEKGKLWGLPNLPENAQDYVFAREAFEGAGRRVYDATVGGKLDVFPKISLDEARRLAGVSR